MNDTWQAGATFTGEARREAVGFAINGIGYVGFGRTTLGLSGFQDLWEYDPRSDTLVQRASLPGDRRSAPSVFVLDSKVYIIGGNPNYLPYLSELWEYDPAANTWQQRSSLPAAGRYGPIAANGMGNLGSENDNSFNIACNDLWQWDPNFGQWTPNGGFPRCRAQNSVLF